MENDAQSREPDIVDRLLSSVDHGLDVVHDKVLRPILLAGRAIAFGFVLVLVSIVLVSLLIIGVVRFANVYFFAGREWISYLVVGAFSLTVGLLLWRRRRPVDLRK